MSILDADDEKAAPLNEGDAASPRQEPRREAEMLANPVQVILDIRRDIEKFQAGGARKEMVEALKDQFIATRHQAAVKAEATRMVALDILRARLHEIKTVSELMRVISALSKMSENDLAAVYGVAPGIVPGVDMAPGSGPMVNIQQHLIGPAEMTQQLTLTDRSNGSNPSSRVLESLELLNKILKKHPPRSD
jgi:hypothetical protein